VHIAVVANGDLPLTQNADLAELVASVDRLIAADGGLVHCVSLGRWPDRLIGDLDSAPTELVEQARDRGVVTHVHPVDKNATDLELALDEAVGLGAKKVTVIAPFGGRLDHELATIALLASPRWASIPMSATDGRRSLWVVHGQLALALVPSTTVSMLPWGGAVTGLTTEGMQWPLTDHTLDLGSTLGVSNVVVDQAQTVSIESGALLVIVDTVEHGGPN